MDYSALWPIYEEGFLDSATFERAFAGAIHHLNLLLLRSKQQQVPPDQRRDPLARIFKAVRQYHHEGLGFVRDWEGFRLGLLASDLESLKTKRPNAYRQLRKDYQHITFNEYFGWRHEVRTAALLTARGISFDKTEAPDFEMQGPFAGSAAECAAVNVTGTTQGKDLLFKLNSAVRKKAGKPYCSKSTILVLDYTNVLFTSVLNHRALAQDEVNESLAATFRETRFGALLAWALVGDIKARRFVLGAYSAFASDAPGTIRDLIDALGLIGPKELTFTVPFTA